MLQVSQYYEIYKLSADILERVYGLEQLNEIEKMQYINSKESEFMI